MRYIKVFILTFLISGCCGMFHKKETSVIKDKSWFPYKTKSSIIYKTNIGIIDSLSIVELDSLNQESGGDCLETSEYRNCILQSNKFKDFQVQVSLDPIELNFKIVYSGRWFYFYYCSTCKNVSNNPRELTLVDSIRLNDIVYNNLLIFADSAKDFEIYYNRSGLLRYIINKDTFDLKK